MRIFSVLWIPVLACATALAQESPPTLLGTSTAGSIYFFDSTLLTPLGSLSVGKLTESLHASPDGKRLYVAKESQPNKPCCGLFTMDLETRQMCPLVSPAMFGLPSNDGRYVYTQREEGGVDLFDAKTLARLSSIETHGTYHLRQSPDGRSLFGITNTPKPAVDIFDIERRELARQIVLPAGPATGAWVGNDFYAFVYGEDGAKMWRLRANSIELPHAIPVQLPDLHGSCKEPLLLMVAGLQGRLLVAEVFGFKIDRRRNCSDQARGGIYVVNPRTGQVEEKIAEGLHVSRMVVDPESNALFALESTSPGERGGSRLVRLDPVTGRILSTRELNAQLRNLTVAHIPASLIPHDRQGAVPCRR